MRSLSVVDGVDWSWLVSQGTLRFEPWGSLTFARGARPDDVFAAFDLDASTALPMCPAEAERWEACDDPADVLRVAEVDGWAVAIEELDVRAVSSGLDQRLSRECDEVLSLAFMASRGIVTVRHFRAGMCLAVAELGAQYVAGPGARRLSRALSRADLDVPDRAGPGWAEYVAQAVATLSREIGFALPADVYDGPLPTTAKRCVTSA